MGARARHLPGGTARVVGVREESRSPCTKGLTAGNPLLFGSPHVRPMGVHRSRGDPHEITTNPHARCLPSRSLLFTFPVPFFWFPPSYAITFSYLEGRQYVQICSGLFHPRIGLFHIVGSPPLCAGVEANFCSRSLLCKGSDWL